MNKTEQRMETNNTQGRKPYVKPTATVVAMAPQALMAGSIGSTNGMSQDVNDHTDSKDGWTNGNAKDHGAGLWDDDEDEE